MKIEITSYNNHLRKIYFGLTKSFSSFFTYFSVTFYRLGLGNFLSFGKILDMPIRTKIQKREHEPKSKCIQTF